MFLSSHFIFWVKYRVIPPSYHKTARQLSPRTLNLSSLSFSSFLQRDPSFCPSRWYQRQAFHSVEGDSENTQDMTVTDESLSARCLNQGQSDFCALSRLAYKRTTPDTHTKQLVLQPHLRQKGRQSNLQSPACFHNRVQQRPQTVARTASPHSTRWQIWLVKCEQNTEHRQHCEDVRRAQRWINNSEK